MQVVTRRASQARRHRCAKRRLAREVRQLKADAHRRHRHAAAMARQIINRGADPDAAFARVAIGGYVTERDII
ncbi:MAG: hypothetical protein V1738_03010 [Patescibacteria group bacterium]